MAKLAGLFAMAFAVLSSAYAADAPPPPASNVSVNPALLNDLTRFEIRGGFFGNSVGPEAGTVDANGEIVFPRIASVPGWQDALIPRLHIGGMGSVSGRTNYAYAGGLWTANYEQFFAEIALGGALHNGPLESADPGESSLGCRALYHVGANLGYRFDQTWSVMATVDHVSNGRGVLSNCPANTGLTLFGVRVGYAF